jgi:hypothetical protein
MTNMKHAAAVVDHYSSTATDTNVALKLCCVSQSITLVVNTADH